MNYRKTLAVSIIFSVFFQCILIFTIAVENSSAQTPEYQDVNLYLYDEVEVGVTNGTLSTEVPSSTTDTIAVCPGSENSNLFGDVVGVWATEPFVAPFTIEAEISCGLWAKSDEGAYDVHFRVIVEVNGEGTDTWIETNTQDLTSEPAFFSGSNDEGGVLELGTGDYIGINVIYFAKNQAGVGPAPDSELLYASIAHDSHITITCNSVSVDIQEPQINENNEEVTIEAIANDTFGYEDISNEYMTITGPVTGVTISKDLISQSGAEKKVQWVWDYGEDQAISGTYAVTVTFTDNSGNDWTNEIEFYLTITHPPNSAPSIEIKTPEEGTSVSGTISITGTASDPDGDATITEVLVKIDNNQWKTATGTTSWSFPWDTTQESEGTHTISAKAYDGESHSSSDSKTVTVDNHPDPPPLPQNEPPSVEIISPLDGAELNGNITIEGSASDPDGDESITKVEVKIDDGIGGNWEPAIGTLSWAFSWNTTQYSNDDYIISARAFDGEDYSSIFTIEISVYNILEPSPPENTPSTVEITYPSGYLVVSGEIMIRGTASDIDGDDTIDIVEIRIDEGIWKKVEGTTSWTYTLNTKELTDGAHIIHARAYDGEDYSQEFEVIIEVDNEPSTASLDWFFYMIIAAIIVILLLVLTSIYTGRRRRSRGTGAESQAPLMEKINCPNCNNNFQADVNSIITCPYCDLTGTLI